ncbi:uncharacterized protein [Nicotiana sylvestris]|uniref:uncharacterized protein n=1 Tax=Nicotiana sylvestris TaxID=4096 RepID=UPI00388CB3A0
MYSEADPGNISGYLPWHDAKNHNVAKWKEGAGSWMNTTRRMQNKLVEDGSVNIVESRAREAIKISSKLVKGLMRDKASIKNYWLICVGKNCTWNIKATSINDSAMFKVRNFDSQHTCSLMDNTFIQCKPTAMVVGSMVIPKYSDPKTIYTPKDIQFDMSEHDVNLTYMKAWRVKKRPYKKTYPGSVVKLKKTDDDCFLYVFVAICTSISGWEYCRPVVVVGVTFLKLAYMGIMLTASTMDAADTILPLAYAVVDSENDALWKWFFEQFKLTYGERPNMCVLSDRNESILKATSIVYPGMPHYSCMWHIWTNILAKFKKGHLKLSELYFATTWSYTLDEFNERMSKIEEIDPRVKAYLYDIGYHRWSRVHATVNRTWTMISNITGSLNVVTKYARELPIVELLEYMSTLLERRTKEKLLKAKSTFTHLGYKFNKELDDNRTLPHKLRVRASTDYIHTVIDGVRRFPPPVATATSSLLAAHVSAMDEQALMLPWPAAGCCLLSLRLLRFVEGLPLSRSPDRFVYNRVRR